MVKINSAGPIVISCSPFYEGWQKLGPVLTGNAVEWVFYNDRPIYFWEKFIRRPDVRILRASIQAVIRAIRGGTRLLITQDPRTSLYCALLCRLLQIRVNHYVNSLNFPELPVGLRYRLMRFAFRRIARFSVHSSMEKSLYSNYFDIPEERIRLRLWSIGIPTVYPDTPLQVGPYVSSIGGNGRDYKTLLAASHILSKVAFVLVVRPENLEGLEVPPNVRVLVNSKFDEAMNILLHSRFLVLPLAGSTVPCGHVTLVCAMHLGKTVVATESAGISDYVFPGFNGVVCEPGSPASMAQAIDSLWKNPSEAARLAENNRRFGAENCSETNVRSDLASVLAEWNIPLQSRITGNEATASEN
jgi:glycosyltransferase involved in cell wall biosynthesis